MDTIKQFNLELASMYECKPPISKAKMTAITKRAIRAIKFYKHVVQSVEKFIQKCKQEYKIPGLYVIDSIVRQSRHQFGAEKDVFAPRFAKNILVTFYYLFKCPAEGKSKVVRVLNLWQKNNIFGEDVIQPLFDLADPKHPIQERITHMINQKANKAKAAASAAGMNQSSAASGGDMQAPQQEQAPKEQHMRNQSPAAAPQPPQPAISSAPAVSQNSGGTATSAAVAAVNSAAAAAAAVTSLDPALIAQIQQILMKQQQQPVMSQQQQQQPTMEHDTLQQGGGPPPPHMNDDSSNIMPTISQTGDYDGRSLPFLPVDVSQPPPGYSHPPPTGPFMGLPPPMGVPPPSLEPGYPSGAGGGPVMGGGMPQTGLPQEPIVVEQSPREEGEHSGDDSIEEVKDESDHHHHHHHHHRSSRSPSSRSRHRRRRSRSRSRSRRSRSGSRSRSKKSPSRSSRRKRSRSRDRRDRDHRDKSFEREKLNPEKEREREAEREREKERKKRGLPPIKLNHLGICSTTLWVGHLSKLVHQEELSDIFGEYGDIVSIDLIPPRGCAFVCMNRRQDASRALTKLRNHKIHNKAITMAWAPGKGVKGKEFKDYWEVDVGCSYIPHSKLTSMSPTDLDSLEEGGVIDEETVPDWLKGRYGINTAPHMPGFLPIGVPTPGGGPPVEGRDHPRDGPPPPPPSLPQGPRMPPHSVMPPYGLPPNMPPPGVGPRGIPPIMPPNMPPNMPPSMPPNMPPNMPPSLPPNMPPNMPRLGVPHTIGLAPPLSMPPVSSILGQPIIGSIGVTPGSVNSDSPYLTGGRRPMTPEPQGNSQDSDSMDVEMEDVQKDMMKDKEYGERGDEGECKEGGGQSISEMLNKLVQENNDMNDGPHDDPRGYKRPGSDIKRDDGFPSMFAGGPHSFPGNRPPHFGGGGPFEQRNGPEFPHHHGMSNGARLAGSMPHGIRHDNFIGINMVANGPGGFGPRGMFGGPRGILGPPPMGMNMMGRPTLIHELHRPVGPGGMQPMQRVPDGLNGPPMVGGGPNGPGGIMPGGVGLMPPQPGIGNWREVPPPMFAQERVEEEWQNSQSNDSQDNKDRMDEENEEISRGEHENKEDRRSRERRDRDGERRDDRRRDYDRDRRDRSSRDRSSRDRTSRDRDRDGYRDRYRDRRDRNRNRSSRDRDRSSRDRDRSSRDRFSRDRDQDRSSRGRSRDRDRGRDRSSRDRDSDRYRSNRYGDGERDRYGRNYDRSDRDMKERNENDGDIKDKKEGAENNKPAWTMSRWGDPVDIAPSQPQMPARPITAIPEEVEIDDDDDDVIMTEEPGSWDVWAQMASMNSSSGNQPPNSKKSRFEDAKVTKDDKETNISGAEINGSIITLSEDDEKKENTEANTATDEQMEDKCADDIPVAKASEEKPETQADEPATTDDCQAMHEESTVPQDCDEQPAKPTDSNEVNANVDKIEEPTSGTEEQAAMPEEKAQLEEQNVDNDNLNAPVAAEEKDEVMPEKSEGIIDDQDSTVNFSDNSHIKNNNAEVEDERQEEKIEVAQEEEEKEKGSQESTLERANEEEKEVEEESKDETVVEHHEASGMVSDVTLDYEYSSMMQDSTAAPADTTAPPPEEDEGVAPQEDEEKSGEDVKEKEEAMDTKEEGEGCEVEEEGDADGGEGEAAQKTVEAELNGSVAPVRRSSRNRR